MHINLEKMGEMKKVLNDSKGIEMLENYGEAVQKTNTKKNKFLVALSELICQKLFKSSGGSTVKA